MRSRENELLAWLASQKQAMINLLGDIVDIDSNSYDKAGVDAVGDRFKRFFSEHGVGVRTIPNRDYGDVLRAEIGGVSPDGPPTILLGHRDTVFPKEEASRRPFRIADGRAYGPGVCDMKAGLVQNAFLLAAFHRCGGSPGPLVALMTSDEEIGSPACRKIIEETARCAKATFNSEPGRPSGNVVTARKGGVFMKLRICGKAAHSGGNFSEGVSAIQELAHKIIALHALVDFEKGRTLNVGLVSGSVSLNTIAPVAEAELDLRFPTQERRDEAMAIIEKIVADSHVAGARTELEILGEFKPMAPNAESNALFATYQAAASDVGLAVAGEFSGGCADSGFAASVGCPTLCGVGPVGWKAHTPDEYLDIDSITPRAQALALAVARLN